MAHNLRCKINVYSLKTTDFVCIFERQICICLLLRNIYYVCKHFQDKTSLYRQTMANMLMFIVGSYGSSP
jgi:hypothetical protein